MRLTLRRPDDWHLHLRDGPALQAVLPHSVDRFARALVMPNLRPPVTTTAEASAYRERILEALPEGVEFEPLMTLYLTDRTAPEEIATARASGFVQAVKYYPAGATTNSENGVTDLSRIRPVLETMERVDLPLCVHGEVTDPEVDVFDREREFVDRILRPLVADFPDLRVVVEHVTTIEAVAFVRAAGPRVAATITAHHLLWNRNELFRGGIAPHAYCLPVLKRERHRRALLEAACEHDRFFLGTDSAPHARGAKEGCRGCAGIYTAHAAIELYAEAFESAGKLDRLEAFASERGADFYGVPRNRGRIALEKVENPVPSTFPYSGDVLVPMRAGGTLPWRLADRAD